jgi:hypothetical protein
MKLVKSDEEGRQLELEGTCRPDHRMPVSLVLQRECDTGLITEWESGLRVRWLRRLRRSQELEGRISVVVVVLSCS